MAWPLIAAAATATLGSLLSSGRKKMPAYKPYGPWLEMQDDIFAGIRKGIEEGGYTWSNEINDRMKRTMALDVSTKYGGQAEKIVQSLVPYGNIGAAGRGLTAVGIAEAQETSRLAGQVDIAREETKLASRENLMRLGAGMRDPMMPQQQVEAFNAQVPSGTQRFGEALSTGAATYMNLSAAAENRSLIDRITGGGPTPTTSPTMPSTEATDFSRIYNPVNLSFERPTLGFDFTSNRFEGRR
jgi:hypothetical protein